MLSSKRIPAGTGLVHADDTVVGSQIEYDRLTQLKEQEENNDIQEVVADSLTSKRNKLIMSEHKKKEGLNIELKEEIARGTYSNLLLLIIPPLNLL